MTEHFSVDFSKNSIKSAARPESVASREDMENKVSFEDELSLANEVTNQKDQDFFEDQGKNEFPLIGGSDLIQKLFEGIPRKGGVVFSHRESKIPEQEISKTADNPVKEEIPSSLVKAAHQANQKVFANISDHFKQLFMAELKNTNVTAERLSSAFSVPKVNIGQVVAEIVERVKLLKDGEVTHLKLDLIPGKLGRLQVMLSLQDKKLVLHIFANEDAKKMLDSEIDQLQKLLSEQGFSIEHLGVEVSDKRYSEERSAQEYFGLSSGKKVPFQDYNMLKIVEQADIIDSIDSWLGDVMVNYVT